MHYNRTKITIQGNPTFFFRHGMKRKIKQWYSTIQPKSTKQTKLRLISNHWTHTHTLTKDNDKWRWISGSWLGIGTKCGGDKPVNGIPNTLLYNWISNSNTDITKPRIFTSIQKYHILSQKMTDLGTHEQYNSRIDKIIVINWLRSESFHVIARYNKGCNCQNIFCYLNFSINYFFNLKKKMLFKV